jgi:hypothetical protein
MGQARLVPYLIASYHYRVRKQTEEERVKGKAFKVD